VEVRRLEPRDGDMAHELVSRFKQSVPGAEHMRAWLADAHHILLVAFERGAPVGWAYGYELPRIDGPQPMYLLYEIDVEAEHRQRGVGTALLETFLDMVPGPVWLITNASNEPAMRLYRSAGGQRLFQDDVMFRFKTD